MSSPAPAIVVNLPRNDTPTQSQDPLEPRYGFQIALRNKPINSQECGVPAIPFGQFFPIRSFNAPREVHSIDWTMPKEAPSLVTAASCEQFLMEALGGKGAQSTVNWGMVTAFHGERDESKMLVISALLLPKLSEIREIQARLNAKVIEGVCPGTDETDFGQREECLTCWWAWLNSNAIREYIASEPALTVIERDVDTQIETTRKIQPTPAEMDKALNAMLLSGRQAVSALRSQWASISKEYESDKDRKEISDFEHIYRKDLHQHRPQDRQLALAREAGKASGGSTDQMLSELVESNKLLTQLVIQDRQQNAPKRQAAKTKGEE